MSHKKPSDKRQRRGTADLPTLVAVTPITDATPAPAATRTWLAEVKRDWEQLWNSDLALHVRETDEAAVRRLFGWRDKQIRAERRAAALRREAQAESMVEGSMGQPVANPLWAAADAADHSALQIENRIVALEDRLGLSPKARLALGVTQQQGINLAGQNARLATALKEAMAGDDPRALPDPTALQGNATEHAG